MGPSRIRRHVPADLRLLGRAGVRREEEPALTGQPAYHGRPHPRLDAHAPEEGLERPHPVEALEREDDAAFQRHGAGREARAAAAGHDRNVVGVAPAEDGRHVLGRLREGDSVRAPVQAPPLRLVAQVRSRVAREHAARAEQAFELSAQRARGHFRRRRRAPDS
jgi:hypothetical protein